MTQIRPLKERLLSTPAAQVTVASPYHCGRLPYYREWSIDKMEKAIKAVHTGTLSVRRAAEVYGIPKSTLHSKIKSLFLPKNLGSFTCNSDDPIFWL